IVVPLSAAGQPSLVDAGKQLESGSLRYKTCGGKMKLGLEPVVSAAAEPGIEFERRTKREPVLRNRSIRSDQKRQRPQEPGGDPRERPPLTNSFTSAS